MATNQTPDREEFRQRIGVKEERKLKAKRENKQSPLQGFGVFGLIGWSVAVPTVLLTLLGLWLDERYAATRSYTLALLIAGLFIGCLNAWYWVHRKMEEMQEEEPNHKNND